MVWESQDPQRAKLVKKFSEENTGNLNTVALGLKIMAQREECSPQKLQPQLLKALAQPCYIHSWTRTQSQTSLCPSIRASKEELGPPGSSQYYIVHGYLPPWR